MITSQSSGGELSAIFKLQGGQHLMRVDAHSRLKGPRNHAGPFM